MFAALIHSATDSLITSSSKNLNSHKAIHFSGINNEKANYFHENILKTAGEPVTSRNVAFLLQTPQQDGGQWDMIVSLFKKYGLCQRV